MSTVISEILSYSRLTTFNDCPRAFWYAYIDGDRGGDNIYSYIGTAVHETVEDLIGGNIDADMAKQRFTDALDDAELLGYQWMSEKVQEKYTIDILHYFDTFNPSVYPKDVHIEDHFTIPVSNYTMQGYIDCWFETPNNIIIEDFKTSSKYSKADLDMHVLQLATYARSLESLAKARDKPILMRFNMLKYAKVGKKLVERCEIIDEDISPGFVEVQYDNVLHDRLEAWVADTMKQVEALNPNLYYRWPKGKTPAKDFFCKNICSHYERCNGMAG